MLEEYNNLALDISAINPLPKADETTTKYMEETPITNEQLKFQSAFYKQICRKLGVTTSNVVS